MWNIHITTHVITGGKSPPCAPPDKTSPLLVGGQPRDPPHSSATILGNKRQLNIDFILFFPVILNWSTADLQCCVNFCCIATWVRYRHICILFHTLFHWWLITGSWISLSACSIRTALWIRPVQCSWHLLVPNSHAIHPSWQPQACSFCLCELSVMRWE